MTNYDGIITLILVKILSCAIPLNQLSSIDHAHITVKYVTVYHWVKTLPGLPDIEITHLSFLGTFEKYVQTLMNFPFIFLFTKIVKLK